MFVTEEEEAEFPYEGLGFNTFKRRECLTQTCGWSPESCIIISESLSVFLTFVVGIDRLISGGTCTDDDNDDDDVDNVMGIC